MGELPEGWKYIRVGDVKGINGLIIDGDWILNTDLQTGNEIRLIQLADIGIGKFLDKSKKSLSKTRAQELKCTFLKEGDLLVSRMPEPIARACIFPKVPYDAITAVDVTIVRTEIEKVDSKFLCYFFNTDIAKKQVEKVAFGTTRKRISRKNLENLIIPLPPLPIQHQIVAILEQAEAVKRQRQEADALTGALLQSVFYELFGDPVENEKGWKSRKLKDISEVVSGVTKGRKLNGKPTVFVPYLRVANVQDGFLDLIDIKDIEVLDSDIEKFQLKKGDVILTEGGDRDKLGRGHVWNEEIPLCIHQNHIFRVRLNVNLLNPEFFSFLIGSAYGKKYFAKSAKQTTGIASINSTQLKNFPALLPPLALQHQFARVVRDVERIRKRQVASGNEIEGLCEGLMARAFAGELVRNDNKNGNQNFN